jgi:hypothetical protein
VLIVGYTNNYAIIRKKNKGGLLALNQGKRYLTYFSLLLLLFIYVLMLHFICFTTYLDNVSLNYTQRDRTIFCSFCLPSLFKLSFKKNQQNYNIYDRNLNISD